MINNVASIGNTSSNTNKFQRESNKEILNKVKVPALIVTSGGVLGALGGAAKTEYIDKPEVDYYLKHTEFDRYKSAVKQNKLNITDQVELAAKNQKCRDEFNNFCEYCYHDGMKKINKRNIIIGALVGLAIGAVGVFAKHKLSQKGRENENNSNQTISSK